MRATPYHTGEHLEEEALRPPSDRCPACGFAGTRAAVVTLQSTPEVTLLRCPRCGIDSASRMPTEAALEAYYGKYYDAADANADAVTFAGNDRFAAHLERLLPASLPARVRVLDFGSGDGAITFALAARLVASGHEVHIALVDYAAPTTVPSGTSTKVTYEGVATLDALPDAEPFDFVIASAILEHVPNVGQVARALFDRVAPGGTFYARTPYWAPFARLSKRVDLTFPGHVHDMGPEFWGRVHETFALDADLVASRPSIVETTLRSSPLRTLVAHLLKAPAHAELALRRPGASPRWRFVGGWEAVLRFRTSDR